MEEEEKQLKHTIGNLQHQLGILCDGIIEFIDENKYDNKSFPYIIAKSILEEMKNE